MNKQGGYSFANFLVIIIILGIVLVGAWYFMNGESLPGIYSPNGTTDTSSSVRSDPSAPTCTITSSVKKVTSPNQLVKFSWTSNNAATVHTESLLSEYDSFQLPLSGSASFQAKNNFKITRIATTQPDLVELTLTAIRAGAGNDCVLRIPYEPQ